MNIYSFLLVLCWAVFMVVWFFSSFTAKSSSRSGSLLPGILLRIGLALIALWAIRVGIVTPNITFTQNAIGNPLLQSIGVICTALGIAFAIWARVYLGRNWGMPMTLRTEPELITSGPYRYVRHPIYTGVLLAIFGSVLVAGSWWLLIFAAATVYFLYSARQEEKDMVTHFPKTYPEYHARTKMLIPFVL